MEEKKRGKYILKESCPFFGGTHREDTEFGGVQTRCICNAPITYVWDVSSDNKFLLAPIPSKEY